LTSVASAEPFVPQSDAQILADLPAGLRHRTAPDSQLVQTRPDVAVLMARFYITRSRATGDLRYLGYAEGALGPWLKKSPVRPDVLVLDATVLQSRHEFEPALRRLDQALAEAPEDPQAWLTRATVLRVLGRYDEASAACGHLAAKASAEITTLCEQSIQSLSGHLQSAYEAIRTQPAAQPPEERAWQCSELGEMAERLGQDGDAEQWFTTGLRAAPDDFYLRAALSDLLLRHQRPLDVLALLAGYESFEPMLLRLTLAHKMLADGKAAEGEALLADAFDVEQRRGEAVHRREQARYLLDLAHEPEAALVAAQANWSVQREPEDALILLRCAQALNRPQSAAPAARFLAQQHLEDIRLDPYRSGML
jgi:predicted Zn-dependent protease